MLLDIIEVLQDFIMLIVLFDPVKNWLFVYIPWCSSVNRVSYKTLCTDLKVHYLSEKQY